jgi:Skp family chaperone for outer membrane proteins
MKKTLFYITLIFCGIAVSCQSKSPETTVITAGSVEGITIAMVDTDSIFANYDMVADMVKELEEAETRLTNDLQRQARNFQTDYENYLRIGSTLTLSEQRQREAALQKRQEDLQSLEQRYVQQLMELRSQRNREAEDQIFSFIEKYNQTHGNFSIIMSSARTSGVLYALPSMDITGPILEGLNAEYAQNRRRR